MCILDDAGCLACLELNLESICRDKPEGLRGPSAKLGCVLAKIGSCKQMLCMFRIPFRYLDLLGIGLT